MISAPGQAPTFEQDADLREALKRCPPGTYEAAREFRRTGQTRHLPAIVQGIIARYVERERRPKLDDARAALRLIEDLGVDSLTLLEIVLLTEEVLRISIDDEELRELRTVGDVDRFVAGKVEIAAHSAAIPISCRE